MKIGIFTETFRPTVNGVVVSIETFKSQLEKRGHEYFIFAPTHHKQLEPLPGVYRFPAVPLPNDSVYPLALPMPLAVSKQYLPLDIIKELDLIHVQHFSSMGQYGLGLAQEYKIPSVYTYHTMADLYTSTIPLIGSLLNPGVRAWTRHTAKQATHVITPTESVKHYLRGIGVKRPISVVPTGIETKDYKRTPKSYLKEHYGIPVNRQVLLFVGRMAAEKNLEFLLQAFRRIQLILPDTHLLLVGGGPDKEKYEDLIQAWKLNTHVTFTGFLPREETVKLFGVGDLFVFPSVTDTQGIVILEAMAAGTVPVAVDRLGPHDIIKNNLTGCLTDLNLEDFSSTIIDLLHNDDKRHQLAVAAKRQATHYDSRVTADAMEQLYERLTRHSRS